MQTIFDWLLAIVFLVSLMSCLACDYAIYLHELKLKAEDRRRVQEEEANRLARIYIEGDIPELEAMLEVVLGNPEKTTLEKSLVWNKDYRGKWLRMKGRVMGVWRKGVQVRPEGRWESEQTISMPTPFLTAEQLETVTKETSVVLDGQLGSAYIRADKCLDQKSFELVEFAEQRLRKPVKAEV